MIYKTDNSISEMSRGPSLSPAGSSSSAPAIQQTCLSTMIVLRHNCNGTAISVMIALEAAIERGVEVACLQEPYVGNKHTISHPGFQTWWPECPKQDTRVVLAIRNDALDRYVFEERTDLAGGPHVQCLDVWEIECKRKVRSTRLTNVDNKARVGGGDTQLTTRTSRG
jgi:hypothetical protein